MTPPDAPASTSSAARSFARSRTRIIARRPSTSRSSAGRFAPRTPRRCSRPTSSAGAGGLSLGLEQAGIQVVVGADHDTEALETHRHHIGGMAIDWDLGTPMSSSGSRSSSRDNQIDVLAGGPPCQPFSKAGRSGMRYLVREGLREPHDRGATSGAPTSRSSGSREPRAVIMENVPDMALDREMFILRSMVFELERSVTRSRSASSTLGGTAFRSSGSV